MLQDNYLHFTVNDLVLDADGVAKALMHACQRGNHARVQCILQLRDEITVVLSDAQQCPKDIRFELALNCAMTEIEGKLASRWQGGYDPVGMICDENETDCRVFILFQKN